MQMIMNIKMWNGKKCTETQENANKNENENI